MKYNVVLESKKPYEKEFSLLDVLDYCFKTCNMFIDVVSVEPIKESNYKYIVYIDKDNNCVVTDFKHNEIEIITKNLDLDSVKARYNNPKVIFEPIYVLSKIVIPDWCQGITARYLPYICEV